jgi:hypothetical protein
MARWFRGHDRAVNSVILGYRGQALWKGWPQVDLPVQFVDQGATSDVIAPGAKVLLGGNVWRVLKVDPRADTALLLSEHVVAYRAYHPKFTEITWEKCALRDWLNREFFQSLPDDFASLVVEKENDNMWKVPPTSDRVFLLSRQEAEHRRYFADRESRVATRHDGDTWGWWLRSPGGDGYHAASVYRDGIVHDYGIIVNHAAGGVRPALTIRIPRS